MINNIKVSIIIPVFNGEQFIKQAIQSALDQTHNNSEIIVVDDGSTDATAQIVKSFKEVRYIHQQNQGVAYARNTALKKVTGDYVAFLDADDYYPKNKLELQLNHLIKNNEIDGSLGKLKNFVEKDCKVPQNVIDYMNKDQVCLASLVAPISIFKKVGLFNTNYKIGSDYEWIARAKEQCLKLEILPNILLYRRIHAGNMTRDRQKQDTELRLKILKESIDRKRKRK